MKEKKSRGRWWTREEEKARDETNPHKTTGCCLPQSFFFPSLASTTPTSTIAGLFSDKMIYSSSDLIDENAVHLQKLSNGIPW